MKTHSLLQGSLEWNAHRATHFNASDAPAMMGCSLYKTRSQLLHEMATGQVPEVDAATQRRFDDGHRIEALARPLAENIIGENFYPVVGSEGKYSASFDGLTMDESMGFEHKTLNAELRDVMHADIKGFELPLQYQVQMEQQCMVSGAGMILFMASKWDDDALIEERHCWYMATPELRARIVAGWKQFSQDLAAYVPPEIIVPAVAAPQMRLPAVSITVNGSISLVDNLERFGTALTAYVERINKMPETDQDFADLEATVKTLKEAEEALDAAETNALAQTESIDSMRRTVALYRETARTNRLLVEKIVKVEKENRRTAIVGDAIAELVSHVKKLNERLGKPYMPTIAGHFHAVIKGLKSLDSIKDKLGVELARCKIEANAVADLIQANLETGGLHGYAFLFADLATICTKTPEDFQNTVTARITKHEAEQAAREESARAQIRIEEQAKAEKDARANSAVELAETDKEERKREAISTLVPVMAPVVSQTFTSIELVSQKPTDIEDNGARLKLGQINELLAPIALTADGLTELGFPYVATEKSAKLYRQCDYPAICEALIQHITQACDLQLATKND